MALLDHLIHDPPSEEIAARLEAAGATCCEHRRNPCTLWCGVRCHTRRLDDKREVRGDIVYITEVHEKLGPWEVIPYSERLATIAMIDYVRRSRA